jgi:hypothetical protein
LIFPKKCYNDSGPAKEILGSNKFFREGNSIPSYSGIEPAHLASAGTISEAGPIKIPGVVSGDFYF